jgi:hypothetical protein
LPLKYGQHRSDRIAPRWHAFISDIKLLSESLLTSKSTDALAFDVSTAIADGRTETNRYRVRVRLARTANGWLVADLTQVE